MDKIWYRKSFEVRGHWPLWRGWKNKWAHKTDKSWTLKKTKRTQRLQLHKKCLAFIYTESQSYWSVLYMIKTGSKWNCWKFHVMI